MKLLLLLLFCAVALEAKSLSRSKPYASFEQLCKKTESVSGFTSFKFMGKRGADLRFMLFCRHVDSDNKLKVGSCRYAKEFDLLSGTGELLADNKFDSDTNCGSGEILNGVKSEYVGEKKKTSKRTMAFYCCKVKNAKVDEKIGCNHIGPEDPLKTTNPFFAIKNVFFPTSACPRDATRGMEITSDGVTIKFCPYAIDGVDYKEDCKEIKKDVKVYKESSSSSTTTTTTTTKTVEEITEVVEENTWTEEQTDAKLECPEDESMQSSDLKLADDGSVLMKMRCAETTTETSEATVTRYTEFTEITEMTEESGCSGPDESVGGMVTQYQDGKQLISLVCIEQSNSEETTTTEVVEEITTETVTIEESSEMVIKNVYYEKRGKKIYAHYVYSEYTYIEESKFEETTVIDETETTETSSGSSEGSSGSGSGSGSAEGGTKEHWFGVGQCKDGVEACEAKCESWKPGLDFGTLVLAECAVDKGKKEKCHCVYSSEEEGSESGSDGGSGSSGGSDSGSSEESEGCLCICGTMCGGESEEARRKRATTTTRRVKTTKVTKTTHTTTSVRRSAVTITTEQRDGVTVYVLQPEAEIERCPEEQCNCDCACGEEESMESGSKSHSKSKKSKKSHSKSKKSKKSHSKSKKSHSKSKKSKKSHSKSKSR